ncbi:hypothetical protein [Georgenia sp. Z1491]|uniref:hypothetical protein n=1 Tax=Georgenia sp. Z1491 TaxID=3416707 RepID=UPI003CF6EFB5
MTTARPRRRTGVGVLRVVGPPYARTAANVVAVLALLSLGLAALVDAVAVAVAALVLGALTLARVLAVPAGLQALLGATALVAAWSSALLLYERLWWLDIAVHLTLNGVLAAVAGELVRRGRLVPPGDDPRGRWGLALTTTAVGTSLAAAWEVAEWIGHAYVDPTVHVTPADTAGDLVAGAVGSAVAGLVLARRAGSGR